MSIPDLFSGKKNKISLHTDPFNKDCVERIFIHIGKGWLSRAITVNATVYFKNGSTKGEHKIEEPTGDIELLFQKINEFINSLD